MKIYLNGVQAFIFVVILLTASLGSADDQLTQSPLFVTGHPVEHNFTSVATGYGAISEDHRHVAAYFSAEDTAKIKIGAAAQVELVDSVNKSEFIKGHVSAILRNADPKTKQSIVTVSMPSAAPVRARTYVSLDITLSSRTSLAVPTTAVLIGQGKYFVFKKDGESDFDKAEITVGRQSPDFTEVKGGLNLNDTVLIQGATEWNQNLIGGGGDDEGDGD